jgi:hypothetical protein
MRTFTKWIGIAALAALTVVGVAPPPAESQVVNPLFHVPFGVHPYAFRRPGQLGFTPLQFAYQAQVLGQAWAHVPPYALGYNPYVPAYAPMYAPMTYPYASSSMAYVNPYMPAIPAYADASGANPYVPASEARRSAARDGFHDLLKNDGSLDWPLALRVLPPALETRKLREQIQAEVLGALDRKDEGKSRAAFVEEASRGIDRLGRLLNQRADEVPLTDAAVTEGRRFLHSLKTRLQGL